MKLLYSYILLLLPCIVSAQGTMLPVLSKELATYTPTSTPIKGFEYQLPHNANSYYADAAKKELFIVLKVEKEINVGAPYQLMAYDLDKNTVKWSIGTNTSNVYITAPYVFTSNNGSTRCYRRTDGKQMWSKTDATIKYIDEQKGILLTDYIRGLNMHTGKTIWQRYLPVKYNWEDIEVVDDSSIIIASGGIYNINIYSGKGWSTNDITSKGEFVAADAIGIIPPSLHYPLVTVPEITNRPETWRTTTSGILTEDNTIYFATSKRVIAIDKETGKLLWQANLLPNTGITSLFVHKDKLLLLNEGKVANTSGIEKKHGAPYISILDKETGTPGDSYNISTDGSSINEATMVDGRIMMLSKAVINVYDGTSGKLYTFATSGNNYHILKDDRYYIKDEGGNRKITSGDCCFIYNSEQGIFNFDKSFFAIRNIEREQISSIDEYGKMQLFYSGKNIIYLNNQPIIQTPLTNKGFIYGNDLYIVGTNTFSVIPLAEPK